jgi:phage tail sheath protein FI
VPERLVPGIYVEEVPRGEQRIATASDLVTAFVGRTLSGPVNDPVEISSIDEYHRVFGGPWDASTIGPSLHDYFENGGRQALVVRVINGGRRVCLRLPAGDECLALEALSPGEQEWLRASVDYDNIDPADNRSFNLILQRVRGAGSERVSHQEIYARVSTDRSSSRYIGDALIESSLMRIQGPVPVDRPDRTVGPGPGAPVSWVLIEQSGSGGSPLTDYDIIGSATQRSGIFALQKAPQFQLLCIPPPALAIDIGPAVLLAATRLCRQQRAMLILDPPTSCEKPGDLFNWLDKLNYNSENALMAFPRLVGGTSPELPVVARGACGAVAGMLSRRDRTQDAWTSWEEAPLLLRGTAKPAQAITDTDTGKLISKGVNVFHRSAGGRVVLKGERTQAGPDCPVSAFRSIRVRRLSLMIEEALRHGTRWVVFEAPGAELRQRVREQVENYLSSLDARGAFSAGGGCPPFFVKCDSETNPQGDDSRASLHFIVGFAVTEPGNYLIFRVSQTVESAKVVPVSMDRFRFSGA